MFQPAHKILAASLVLALAACGGDGGSGSAAAGGEGRVFRIAPGPNASTEMVVAMVQARPRDVIEFGCGYFELNTGFSVNGTEDILVRGCGINKTVLSFKNSNSQEGILATNVRGFTVQDLTVLDTPGDGFKLKGVNHGTLSRVRAFWSSGRNTEDEDTVTAENFAQKINSVQCTSPATENPANPLANPLNTSSPDYTVSVASGRYGIYPVESRNILVENSESIGASDAGIYVGQTNNAIIRNSRAAFNVFGFEIENVMGGEYVDNVAECNTGGFLIYDLDGLTQYGKRSRMYRNVARNNNTYNFAEPGTIVSNVPRGSAVITLAYDKIDIFDNVFENNDTGGIIITSYEVLGVPSDNRLDMYSEAVHIFNNTFRNNGNNLPPPDLAQIVATQGGQVTSAFPMIVGLKSVAGLGEYRGAHIIWDGLLDELDADCPYPVDFNGQRLPADEDGKPIQGVNMNPNPSCRYNAYKFNAQGERITPKWWMTCIAASNDFSSDSEDYFNFNGLRGLESVFALTETDLIGAVTNLPGLVGFPGSFDIEENDCPARFGSTLPLLAPVVIEPFQPSGTIDPAPSEADIQRLCTAAVATGRINAGAVGVNCPRLDQYNLFSNPQDPTSLPNGQGLPYALNSKLFTDHSVKHRTIYLPEGQKMRYRGVDDASNSGTPEKRANDTVMMPVGTIIAKTFSFVNAGVETPYETRLLIKRAHRDGRVYWDALEYIWATENGQRVARLNQSGGSASAVWDFVETDSGTRQQGSTDSYLFPNANQCLLCHANNDQETGSAPIGPKVRNLNRAYKNESPVTNGLSTHPINGQNQLQFFCSNGFMDGCPADLMVNPLTQIAAAAERVPVFNIPGDSGFAANSAQDIEARVRAYLEVNCAHCHNPGGQASNTGYYLDVLRPVNSVYGICKGPTATGTEGRGGREFDIVPGDAAESITAFRIGPDATTPGARMPPLARSAVHTEASALIARWINEVVDDSYEDADACGGGSPVAPPGGAPGLPLPSLPLPGGLLP